MRFQEILLSNPNLLLLLAVDGKVFFRTYREASEAARELAKASRQMMSVVRTAEGFEVMKTSERPPRIRKGPTEEERRNFEELLAKDEEAAYEEQQLAWEAEYELKERLEDALGHDSSDTCSYARASEEGWFYDD